MASARIQRWALTLSAYKNNYNSKQIRKQQCRLISRLPLPETPTHIPEPGEMVLLTDILDSSAVTAAQVKAWTTKDPILAQVREAILQKKLMAD